MDLTFDLRLTDRQDDRVTVAVHLGPRAESARIDGLEVWLVTRAGDPLSHRMVLPIAGEVLAPMVSTVVLRSSEPLSIGCRVQGVAWRGQEQVDASCPADPGTQLEAHMRGVSPLVPKSAEDFDALDCDEKARLAQRFPWLTRPCERPVEEEPRVVDEETDEVTESEELREFCAGLGLDDDCTDWLEDLLKES